jgi:formylglycine-generating enzyme required for sulfatase activity
MPKSTTTICLAFISLSLFAQPSTLPLNKILVKNILQNVSYIPSKSFVSNSYTGSDSLSSYKSRFATNQSFYISRVEVTNKEYRDFVQHIKDSTAHSLLHHFKEGSLLIDWSRPINWEDPLLESIMLSQEERILGRNEINPGKIMYEFEYSGSKETINVYPDSLVWIRDFAFSYNEPLAKHYFSNSKYDNYPVVGLNLKQAIAFCHWKTVQINKLLNDAGNEFKVLIRLPTNTEWEAAASEENMKEKLFSPGKSYQSNFGNIKDNHGINVKEFQDDGHFYTAPVNSYSAGAYGLYNMKGNVAEWTSTSREEVINAEIKPGKQRTSFVVKGGGWNSIPFYLQTGVCQFFPVEATHSFIGFRYVVYVVKK